VRVWRWRLQVRAEVVMGLVGSVPAGWEDGFGGFPALGSPGIEAGPGLLAGPWFVYRAALDRVIDLQDELGAWVASHAMGLPAMGRTCPVEGRTEFSPTWGEERPWGRTHKGEDLHADRGTPLVAVESGTVLQSGWHWQGGFGVWLAGYYSGDVYYYAHLAAIAPGISPGAVVEVGTLLGWVGSTGNATSPHLHFGWIPDELGRWPDLTGLADPYPLLVGLCR
jgi:murein DD-endopeptidase MepM/ murein hydrolase activator NlpD